MRLGWSLGGSQCIENWAVRRPSVGASCDDALQHVYETLEVGDLGLHAPQML